MDNFCFAYELSTGYKQNYPQKHFTNVDKLCIIKNVDNPKPGKRVKNIILDYKGVQKHEEYL